MIRLGHLAGDTIVYGIVSATRGFVGLLLVPLYTRAFLPGNYGRIDVLTTLVAFLAIILTLGMDTATAIYFYDNQGESDRATMLTTAITTRGGFSLVIAFLVTLLAPIISWGLFKTYDLVNSVRLAAWIAPVIVLSDFLLGLLRLSRRRWLYTSLSVTNLLLQVLLSILFVIFWHWGVAGALAGILGSHLLVLPVELLANKGLLAPCPSRLWLKKLLKVGLPLVPAAFGGWLMAYANRYFLLYFRSAAEVGLLAVGYKVSAPLALFTGAFLIAWGPFAFSLQKQDNAREIYAKALTYFLIIAGSIAVTVSLFAREVLLIFATPDYVPGHVVAGLMAFQLMADTSYYIFSIGLFLTQRTKVLATGVLIAAGGSILLNLLLVPALGFLGAAVANTLSYSLSAMIVYSMAQREFRIPYDRFKVRRLVMLCLGTWVLSISITLDSPWLMVGLKCLVLGGFVTALFLLRILGPGEVNLSVRWFRQQLSAGRTEIS